MRACAGGHRGATIAGCGCGAFWTVTMSPRLSGILSSPFRCLSDDVRRHVKSVTQFNERSDLHRAKRCTRNPRGNLHGLVFVLRVDQEIAAELLARLGK